MPELRSLSNNGELQLISSEIRNLLNNLSSYEKICYTIGERHFDFNKAYVMGILNVTPDSFSDGGKFIDPNTATAHAIKMINAGADIIDIGGESTRPGSEPVNEEEELNRVIPVIEHVLNERPDAIISLDTTKYKVACEGLERGVKIINDISGLRNDPRIADAVLKHNAALVIMHMKGTPENMQTDPYYDDVVSEVYDFLVEKTEQAETLGIEKIFVDPGIGFGKRVKDSYELINRLEEFKGIGSPVLIGLSRKSFIGKPLNLDIDKRDNATIVGETIAMQNGAKIIRTHNVENAVEAVRFSNNFKNTNKKLNV
jgi:dihydropteroate synthase